ncbi:MAG TPA: heparinase II/III family protein [Rariglobus sp.]|nr:heparinase II/III family protein [Rariglobus sp.]
MKLPLWPRLSGLVFVFLSLGHASFAANADSEIPESMPVKFTAPARPFLLLSPTEMAAAREKVATVPWAKEALKDLLVQADQIVADPTLFPDGEGGWGQLYVSPKTGAKLHFDPKSPHKHYCPAEKTYYTSESLDQVWNTMAMNRTAEEQQTLATAWLLTGEKRYAEAMRSAYLEMADKYALYRLHDRSMTRFGDDADTIAGIATSQSIEECNLLTALAFSYDTLAGSGVLSAADQKTIETKLWHRALTYMHRIMALHPSGGNWWIWHACGAIVLGVEFGDQKLVSLGLNTPHQGVLSMIRAGYVNHDGFTEELSPGYHFYPFKALSRMALATRQVGINFYELPRFRKMFDLPIELSLPNLDLPRLNDGGGGTLVTDESAGLYELAFHWYGDPAYGALLHDIYSAPSGKVKRDNSFALLYGTDLPEKSLTHTTSSFLTDSGLSILRTPLSDWNVFLKDDFHSSGHRHPDALNLILYANGSEALPGTASPSYGNPAYLQWFSQTIGHNTVTINTHSQRMSPKEKKMEIGFSWEGLAAAQASAADVQGDKKGKIAPETPVALRRTVLLTPHAVIDLFRVTPKEPASDKTPVNQIDWALHLNGTLTLDTPTQSTTDTLIPIERLNAPQGARQYWPHQGYKMINDLKTIAAPSDGLHGTLTQENGGKVDLWISPAATKDEKVYSAEGPGLPISLDHPLPMLLRRDSANALVFGAVYAPFKDTPTVSAVRFPLMSSDHRGAAVEVVHHDGTDLVLSLPETGTLTAAGATLVGTLGCRIELAQGARMVLLSGQKWQDAEIALTLDQPGSVIVKRESDQIRIHNASGISISGDLRLPGQKFAKHFQLQPGKDIACPL